MNDSINISLTAQEFNKTIYLDTVEYKGESSVFLDLVGINEDIAPAFNIAIDWGDGSDVEYYNRDLIFSYRTSSIFNEIEIGKGGGSILTLYNHTYESADTHILELSAQLLIGYEDGSYLKLVQPLTLIQESYYDNIKEFQLLDSVVHDDTLRTVLTLQSKYNDRTYLVSLGSTNTESIQEIIENRVFITEDSFFDFESEDSQYLFTPEEIVF